MMKRNFALYALVAMVFAATVVTGCSDPEPEPVKVSSITVSPSTHTLEIGGTVTLTAAVQPSDAENKTYTWSSSDNGVASVSSAGVVTANGAGTATITATANDGSNAKGTATITVNPVPVTIAASSNLNLNNVNEITYSAIAASAGSEEGVNGSTPPHIVTVAATDNVEKLTLSLTTDSDGLNAILGSMGLTAPFELGSLSAEQAAAIALIGFPTGDEVKGKSSVLIPLDGLFGVIATQIPGGINQFDIKIEAEDANGEEAEPKTLKLKFIDDVTVWGAIAGDGFDITEVQVINKSEAAGESRKIDITSRDGIENLFVEIDNARINAMIPGGFPADLDLANPGANAQLLAMIGQMGLTLPSGDDVKGKTQLSLNMTAGFIGALVSLGEGTTAIKLTVVDAADHAVTETLTITIVDDLKLTITGDGIGGEPLWIGTSNAGETPVVVNIEAVQGIENFKVLITSSSAAFTGGLTELNLTNEFDLANPDEALSGSLAAIAAMGIELPSGNAVKGRTALEFDITSFIPMIFGVRSLAGEEGTCSVDFKLTVTDGKGKTETQTIKLSLGPDTRR